MASTPTADRIIRQIVGRSLIYANTISIAMTSRITRILTRLFKNEITGNAWIPAVTDILEQGSQRIGDDVAYANLMSWVSGYAWTWDLIPSVGQDAFFETDEALPPPPEAFEDAFDVPEEVRFPRIERAAQSLLNKQAMLPEEFAEAAVAARRQGFTVAGDMTVETLADIQKVLGEDIQSGTSLRTFRKTVNETVSTSWIGEGHLENVYRTNAQTSFSEGQESLMENPIVTEMFPYQEHISIRDDRVRDDHLELETEGLNGTGVYRRDDPIWNRATSPLGYQCRCVDRPLTIRQAARKGVKEAQRWLETGDPPTNPEWRSDDVDFEPTEGFGARRTATGPTRLSLVLNG